MPHFVFYYENLTEISQHESKSLFFLSRSHIGRDSGFSEQNQDYPDEIGMVGQSDFVEGNINYLIQLQLLCFDNRVVQSHILSIIAERLILRLVFTFG